MTATVVQRLNVVPILKMIPCIFQFLSNLGSLKECLDLKITLSLSYSKACRSFEYQIPSISIEVVPVLSLLISLFIMSVHKLPSLFLQYSLAVLLYFHTLQRNTIQWNHFHYKQNKELATVTCSMLSEPEKAEYPS